MKKIPEESDAFMRKNIFAKYMLTFVLIIVVSFSILAWIFTTMIRSYSSNERDVRLVESTTAVALSIERYGVPSMSAYVDAPTGVHGSLSSLTTLHPDLRLLLCNPDGLIYLETTSDGEFNRDTAQGLGQIDITKLTEAPITDSTHTFLYDGSLGSSSAERVYATEVFVDGRSIGYVLAARSTAVEDALVGVVRSAIFTSSIWVILASLIAVYFITERMLHPLREITSAAKTYAKGDFSHRVQIFGDDEISELGHAFNQMAEALEKLDVMRTSFLANVSHDLRTPMTTIAGFIDGINSGAIPPEKHAHYLNIISAEVHRLSRLVSELLDVSRLESGERTFHFVDFDVAEMARIILISFEQRIEEKRLDVEFLSDDTVIVNADKDAIHQVLYNLCHNAIKFADVGGRLRILICPYEENDKKIAVSVFDEGQTVDRDEVKLIFDRFYKTDKSRGLDKTGVGLGLYISKAIMDAHGEQISAASVNVDGHEGCEFLFTLKRGSTGGRKGSLS